MEKCVHYSNTTKGSSTPSSNDSKTLGGPKAFSKTLFHSDLPLATILQLVTLKINVVLRTISPSQLGLTSSSTSNRFVIENSERQGGGFRTADVAHKPQTTNLDEF
ncbi:hypothetical protein TNCV_5118471 [Trichonephila clavipes]|nr:hypothetical protein TNCV_5118471 [Trichonephila clavipes]